MKYQEIFDEFTRKFNHDPKQRGIGIEMELPVIAQDGEAVTIDTIQDMFVFLESEGFQLERDDFSDYIIGASRSNRLSSQDFDYNVDTVMTDAGSGIIELVLAPQLDLHALQESFSNIMALLVTFFDTQQCKVLGFGIQPLTAPSRKLLMPRERYLFFEEFSPNHLIPKSEGADAHLLTISASNQCHIDIGREEAISAVNVLNAMAGLQIVLNANSSVWQGRVDPDFKANREVFWEHVYPDRRNQMGIPPQFQNLNDYLRYLLDFEPMLVEREQLLQILDQPTIRDYLLSNTPALGQTLGGERRVVHPSVQDIHYLNTFCYFNARLVPKLGTVESRVCCQQPPEAALAPTALTLGLLTNLEEAEKLVARYPWEVWEQLREDALKGAFATLIKGVELMPLLAEVLDCARQGLQQRNLGEEVFLDPLFARLECQKSPADEAIEIIEQEGFESFVNRFAFTKKAKFKVQPKLSVAVI